MPDARHHELALASIEYLGDRTGVSDGNMANECWRRCPKAAVGLRAIAMRKGALGLVVGELVVRSFLPQPS
jgi:hypothetical protein